MKRMIPMILILTPLFLRGQEAHSYNLDVHINIEARSLNVEGYIDVDFENRDSLNFILWKNSTVEKIEMSGYPCIYSFDTTGASPSFFTPNGKNLTIRKPFELKRSNQRIHLVYTSDMSDLANNWEGTFSDEWMELAFYSGWYPILEGNYKASLRVYIDEEYKVSGSGIVVNKNGYWEINKEWKSFDIVLMASKGLKSKVYEESNNRIQIDYTNLSESDSDSTFNDCILAFKLFEKFYGKKEGSNLKIVIGPPRKGGGYSRKNFIAMPANNYSLNLSFGNAHEIAHFWWSNAPVHNWEDWLNEAFAEYSALVFMRERFGAKEFDRLINEYKGKTKDTPAIWGIDRQSQEAYVILYFKGSLILSELEKKLGEEQFFALLNNILNHNINSTDGLLKLISSEVSEDVSKWLENELKTR